MTMYLELDDKISFAWGDQSVASGLAALSDGAQISFGSFRLNASAHSDALVGTDALTVRFVRDGDERIAPYPSFHAGPTPHSVAVATEQDFVSEAALIAHLAPAPFRLAFLADDGRAGLAAAGRSITGSAFAEPSPVSTVDQIFQSGELIMTFVDDRLGGYLNLSQPSGVASSWFDDASPAELVLADRTTIRLTGLIEGFARKLAGSAVSFAPASGCFAA